MTRWRTLLKSKLLRLALATITLAVFAPLAGCSKSADDEVAGNAALSAPVPPGMVRGTVLETMDSGGYTYVLVDTGAEQLWAATQQTAVKVGDVAMPCSRQASIFGIIPSCI